MVLQEANCKQLERWDDFVNRSINGSLFHKKTFLAYHGTRFQEGEKYLVFLKGTVVYAQISLFIYVDQYGRKIAKSPYGASWGGIILSRVPSYAESKEMITLFIRFLQDYLIDQCFITQPPELGSTFCQNTFLFAMLEQGFFSVNRDIESIVTLEGSDIENTVTASVRSQVKAAEKAGILINEHPNLNKAYQVLLDEKLQKWDTVPTHSEEEFLYLHQQFPNEIYTMTAEIDENILAGVTGFLLNKDTAMSFYFFVSEDYKKYNALRPVVLYDLTKRQKAGMKFYSFGTSSDVGIAHPATFQFKEGFSRKGCFRETFVWEKRDESI